MDRGPKDADILDDLGTAIRSIWSSRRRASRARWSSSALGTLFSQVLVLNMEPSTAGMQIDMLRRAPKTCELLHIAGNSFRAGSPVGPRTSRFPRRSCWRRRVRMRGL